MSHRSGKRNIELLSADRAGSSCSACDIGSPRAKNGSIESLCAARTEFHDGPSFCSPYDPRGLCCDQRLVVDRAKESGLKELSLNDRSSDFDKRFFREHDSSFRDRPYVTSELEISKVINEVFLEMIVVLEESKVIFRELE